MRSINVPQRTNKPQQLFLIVGRACQKRAPLSGQISTHGYDLSHALVSEHDKGGYESKYGDPPWNPYTDPFAAKDPHDGSCNPEVSSLGLVRQIRAYSSYSIDYPYDPMTQTNEYHEAVVAGDITAEEIARATDMLNNTLSQVAYTWTITPLSSSQHVPTDRYFYLNRTEKHGNVIRTTMETIHFAETFASQLAPDQPSGFGTYQNQSQIGGLSTSESTKSVGSQTGAGPTTKAVGQIRDISQHVPTDRYFYLNRTETEGNVVKTTRETIHFAETFASQLDPVHPSGFGAYQNQSQIGGLSSSESAKAVGSEAGVGPTTKAVGQIVRWPRWGSRLECQLIEDLGRYLTPHSSPANMTYLFVPWTAVHHIFGYMGLAAPTAADFRPVNFTAFMEGADTPNVTASESEVALMSKWWDNGVSHSFSWFPVRRGEDGNGWVSIEIVMVRLNESYTAENSTFQVYGELGTRLNRTRIGFDAAICVEEVKGYVLDAYNSSAGSPVSISLQYNGTQLDPSALSLGQDPSKYQAPKRIGQPLSTPGLQHSISSVGKFAVYNASHYNARNIMLKDNGRDWWFAPNPTVSGSIWRRNLTDPSPTQYTKLNAENVAKIIANSDSQHLLPYLVGSQPVIAHVYPDKTVAYTYVYTVWLAVILAIVLVNGIVVSVFVPRLPLGVSRRDIGVTSWLAAIEGGLVFAPIKIPSVTKFNQTIRPRKLI
ncbi:unnamed protein product [Rhizoctonia solani]|uniref:Uncharacterized protein n=1 Tax=Rhizoctonia solani TaxID=456999 RepID=A0A8H3BRV2_9AGAM|nr:unnamed protein product [Rhizoctonia solani]